MMRLGAALALTLLGACAELRQRTVSDAPSGLTAPTADPMRSALAESAAAFAGNGTLLTGHPAEAAQAVAQVEFLAYDSTRSGRWAALPSGIPFELAAARRELRSAIGIAPDADPQRVMQALIATARDLRGSDRAAAARVLTAPVFPAGAGPTVLRLSEVAPAPQTANTLATLSQEVRRLDIEQRWEAWRNPDIGGGGGRTTIGTGITPGLDSGF